MDFPEITEALIAKADCPQKWFLLGMLTNELMQVEARHSFGTGDKGRICRGEKAIMAREQIDRIRAAIASGDYRKGEG